MLLCFHCSRGRVPPVLVLFFLLGMVWSAMAAQSPFTPYEHRALYLLHFASFSTWPDGVFPDDTAPLMVGVVGEDPFGKAMNRIKGLKIGERVVEVKRFDFGQPIEGCQLLFIADSERARMAEILVALRGKHILTVSESPGFLDAGGMINLEMNEEKKLLFEVNLVAVRRAGLKLNSQLLRLAKDVRTR